MAPFQGITGAVYRDAFIRHFDGIDKMFTPFFTAIHKDKSLGRKASELSVTTNNGIPIVPQILSKDSEEIIRFGNHCYRSGFSEINWNLGCPYPRVANKKRGSGMLPFPDLIEDILEHTIPKLNLKFSVKCRLGYFNPDEILKLIPVFNHHKIYELTIHARIGKQMYRGEVDINSFVLARKQAEMPVIYNGDIFSVQHFKIYSEKFQNINTWMIGRGLLSDPFLPGDIRNLYRLNNDERQTIVRDFAEDLYLSYRKNKNDSLHILGIMKELWNNLALSFDHPGKVFNAIKKAKSFEEYEDSVQQIFEAFKWQASEEKKTR